MWSKTVLRELAAVSAKHPDHIDLKQEQSKLGENANARLAAVAKGLRAKLTTDELANARLFLTTAEAVAKAETLLAALPTEKPVAERMYGPASSSSAPAPLSPAPTARPASLAERMYGATTPRKTAGG
jgi:hypothetical protein